MKETDFYSALYERLRNAVAVASLKAAGVAAERLALQTPVKRQLALPTGNVS